MSWSEVRPWHAKYFWEFGASNPKFQNPLHVLVWGQTVACNHVFRNPPPRFMDFGFFRNLGHADITGQLISACHGLTSDRDMQISFGPAQAECYKPRPFRYRISFHFILISWVQVLNFKGPSHICMSRSEVRPWHADFRKNPKSINLGGGFRNTWLHATVWPQTSTCKGSGNFGAAYPRFPKVLCMPRSDLRPGHARGLGIFYYLPQIPKSTLHATVWPQTRTCKGSWNFAGLVAFVLVNMCQQNKPWRIDNSYRQLVF